MRSCRNARHMSAGRGAGVGQMVIAPSRVLRLADLLMGRRTFLGRRMRGDMRRPTCANERKTDEETQYLTNAARAHRMLALKHLPLEHHATRMVVKSMY